MRTLAFLCLFASPVLADAPVVTNAVVKNGLASVTLTHPDTGWDHYADVWRVFAPDGTMLVERILVHPHVNEQPFTRSGAISLPAGIDFVTIVAGCTHDDHSEHFHLSLEK